MRLKAVLFMAAFALLAVTASAQSSYWSDRLRYDREGATLFFPNEFSLDLFGTYADRDKFGTEKDRWGGGAGVTYFLNRYAGIMADSYLEEARWPYRVNGSLVLRLPIDRIGAAPYVFGGGGREMKYVPQWTEHVGGGLEFRINPHTGIFADGRRVFSDKTKDTALVRFGVKLIF
jgi:hypothetical protein